MMSVMYATHFLHHRPFIQ